MKLDYQVTRDDIAAYQYAVRDRAQSGSSKRSQALWAMAGALALLAFLFLFDRLLSSLVGRETNPTAITFGALFGAGAVVAAHWNTYFKFRKQLVRVNGPSLARQSLETREAGLSLRSPFLSTDYQWTTFTDVTTVKGIVILWIEPVVGLVIPKSAFSDETHMQAFVGHVSACIATSKPS